MMRDQRGYIVVETVGSFLLFVLCIVSILSLINITVVQTRVHYAMTQAAQTLSMYCYALEAAGVADHLVNLAGNAEGAEAKAKEFQSNVIGVIEGLESLSLSDVKEYGSAAYGQAEDAISDPKETVRLLLNYGIKKGSDEVFQLLVKPLILHYLRNGEMDGNEYLNTFRIDVDIFDMSDGSWSVSDTSLLNGDGEVKITAHYYIDYTFGGLMLPFEPKLEVTQTVLTKAWLGGHGEGYST